MRFATHFLVVSSLFLIATSQVAQAQSIPIEADAGCADMRVIDVNPPFHYQVEIDFDAGNPGTRIYKIDVDLLGKISAEVNWASKLTHQSTTVKRTLDPTTNPEDIEGSIALFRSVLDETGSRHTVEQDAEIVMFTAFAPAFVGLQIPLIVLHTDPNTNVRKQYVLSLGSFFGVRFFCGDPQTELLTSALSTAPTVAVINSEDIIANMLASNIAHENEVTALQGNIRSILNDNAKLTKQFATCDETSVQLDIALKAEQQKVLTCEQTNSNLRTDLERSTSILHKSKNQTQSLRKSIAQIGRKLGVNLKTVAKKAKKLLKSLSE